MTDNSMTTVTVIKIMSEICYKYIPPPPPALHYSAKLLAPYLYHVQNQLPPLRIFSVLLPLSINYERFLSSVC